MSVDAVRNNPSAQQADRLIDDGPLLLRGPGLRPEVMRDFRMHIGSPFAALFPGAAFDEVALVPVAAAVDATGRFAENFTDRGIRSGLSGVGVILGNPAQRADAANWLKHMHREVHGEGVGDYQGVRYSALTPELWIWIAMSGVRLVMSTFPLCTGHRPTPAENEAMYQYLRHLNSNLELPSAAGKLPANWAEFERRYDDFARSKLRPNRFMRENYANLSKLPLPTLLLPRAVRVLITPLWLLIRGISGHFTKVCSTSAMHPAVADASGYRLTWRHHLEFRAITGVLGILWRVLPARLRTDPFTYERLQLEEMELQDRMGPEYWRRRDRLEKRVESVIKFGARYQLESFAVPASRRGGCPVAK
ncbi:oxygenase MpaB family protein [Mycobacterium sp. pUA109]|uniref:oxygenase MpaB family protein n=1 Tax=Mycobacterium sp. pUA109 TaxID=3238982 RepID=UPI00351ADC94